MTCLARGHGRWHLVKPHACHLSSGLLQEPSCQAPLSCCLALRLVFMSPSTLCQALAGCQREHELIKAQSLPPTSSDMEANSSTATARAMREAIGRTQALDSQCSGPTSSPATHKLSQVTLGKSLNFSQPPSSSETRHNYSISEGDWDI